MLIPVHALLANLRIRYINNVKTEQFRVFESDLHSIGRTKILGPDLFFASIADTDNHNLWVENRRS